MNKTDLIQKVKALDGLSQDERAYLINLVNTKKKYGLVWEDKLEEVEEQLRENLPVLKEVKDKAIVNGEEYPNHILIEGDNLHALTALSFTHEGKVDVIYIDPPYNTGNKDFKYNDHFVDKEDGYRHSKWLNFISKRLHIAKRLLNEKGVIFISIDDNEQAQLKLLLSEIFTEANFVSNIVWSNKEGGGSSDSKHFRIKHEYILCFARKIENINFNGVEISNRDRYTMQDEFEKVRGPYYLQKLGMGSIQYSTSLDYEIKAPDGTLTTPILNNSGKKACWRWSQKKLKWGLENSFVEFKKDKNNVWIVYTKQYLNCDNEGNLINRTQRPFGVIDSFSSTQASKNLEDLGLANLFNYSKPSALINYLLKLSADEKSVVLDFFAGSGTTLHATMQLNAEDDGMRNCILVTNNENNICEEVTYERNKRVIQGYTNAKGIAVDGLANNNLRYYKSEFVSREPSLKNKRELTQLATELLCIKEDCYTEQKIKIKQAKLFANARVTLLILFDDHIIPDAVDLIKGMDAKEIKVYVFSMGSDPYTEDFADVLDKVTLCALPDAIYKAYQNVLPKKKRTVPLMEEVSQTPTNENGEQLSIL